MTKLKNFQEITQKAIRAARADEKRREFTRRNKDGNSLFAMVPYPLLFNRHATSMDHAVYSVILGYCKMGKTTSVRTSQGKMADILETSPRMISFSVQHLEALDWLKVERHLKSTSTYFPRTTETPKAQEIRFSGIKPRERRKPSRLQKQFLKQWAEAEEAKEKILKWFGNLSKEEAEKFHQEHSEDMDYINEED